MTYIEHINAMRNAMEEKYQRSVGRAIVGSVNKFFEDLNRGVQPENASMEVDNTKIKEVYFNLWRETGLAFAMRQWNVFKKSIGYEFETKGIEEDMYRDIWAEQMLNYARINAGERIVSITGSVKKFMQKTLKDLIRQTTEEGIGVDRIANEIYNRMKVKLSEYAHYGAKRIAMTEVLGASNKGSLESARSTGYPMLKIWVTSPGISKTDRHVKYPGLEGQTKMITEPFEVGIAKMQYPGAYEGPAEEVINCKCGVLYKVL